MRVTAIIDIDVVSNSTGEILEMFKDIWLGDFKKIYAELKSRYDIVSVARSGDLRMIIVEEVQ